MVRGNRSQTASKWVFWKIFIVWHYTKRHHFNNTVVVIMTFQHTNLELGFLGLYNLSEILSSSVLHSSALNGFSGNLSLGVKYYVIFVLC